MASSHDVNAGEAYVPPAHKRAGALARAPSGAIARLPTVYEDRGLLPRLASPAYYATVGMPQDGSCWYHTVAFLTNLHDYARLRTDGYALRHDAPEDAARAAHAADAIVADFRCGLGASFSRAAYDHLTAEGLNPTARPYDGVRASFCNTAWWADTPMIQHTVNALGINLLLLDDTDARWYCGVHGAGSARLGIVVWVLRGHFQPVVRVDDAAAGRLTTLFDPAASADDRALVDAILTRWEAACTTRA